MTKAEVHRRVVEIRAVRNDSEVAHAKESELYLDVLKAIANGTAEDARALARVALVTQKFGFARWCA